MNYRNVDGAGVMGRAGICSRKLPSQGGVSSQKRLGIVTDMLLSSYQGSTLPGTGDICSFPISSVLKTGYTNCGSRKERHIME